MDAGLFADQLALAEEWEEERKELERKNERRRPSHCRAQPYSSVLGAPRWRAPLLQRWVRRVVWNKVNRIGGREAGVDRQGALFCNRARTPRPSLSRNGVVEAPSQPPP